MTHRALPSKFDAQAADQISAMVDAWRGHLQLDDADIEWGKRMLSAYADVPAIETAKDCRAYRRQLAEIMTANLGRRGHEQDAFAAFLRTGDGALAVALTTRIQNWRQQRAERLRRPFRVAGKIRRAFKGV